MDFILPPLSHTVRKVGLIFCSIEPGPQRLRPIWTTLEKHNFFGPAIINSALFHHVVNKFACTAHTGKAMGPFNFEKNIFFYKNLEYFRTFILVKIA
jgi:hypothetical protein